MVDLGPIIDNFTQAATEIVAVGAQVSSGIVTYLRDNYLTTLAAILVVGLLLAAIHKKMGRGTTNFTNMFK